MGQHGSQWVTAQRVFVFFYILSFYDIAFVKQGVYLLVIETEQTMTTEATYNALIVDLTALEGCLNSERRAVGDWEPVYLTDTNVDYENVIDGGLNPGDDGFWAAMVSAAGSAAGGRAEDYHLDLNALLGRIVY